jgi:hypothetical protein
VVVIVVAVSLIVLLGITAITVDGGMLYNELRKVRATADAAAMAAACDLFENYPKNQGLDPANKAHDIARNVAASNGYRHNGTTCTVTVSIPPSSGPYKGKGGYAEVTVTSKVKRGFSRIFGSEDLPVTARSVSRGAWISPNAGVLILDYEDRASLNTQGNGAFTETGGPVIINSNNPSAVVASGNGTLYAQEFYITGGLQLGGNATLQTTPVADQVFLGTHPTPDPLAYLPVPAVPADGTVTKTSLGSGNHRYVLTPGRYSDLPNFNTGDEVLLQQASVNNAGGIYYLDGGGFHSTGATVMVDPTTTGGVLLYNAPRSTANSEKIQITGNPAGTVNITPLTSGPYAGMALWQDRTSPVDILVEGNGNFSIKGTFYAANALVNPRATARRAPATRPVPMWMTTAAR